jgi:hypothetical protein
MQRMHVLMRRESAPVIRPPMVARLRVTVTKTEFQITLISVLIFTRDRIRIRSDWAVHYHHQSMIAMGMASWIAMICAQMYTWERFLIPHA